MRHATSPNSKSILATTTTERKREDEPKGSDSLKSRSPAKSCGVGSGMHMPRGQVDFSQCRRDREERAACDSSTFWVFKTCSVVGGTATALTPTQGGLLA